MSNPWEQGAGGGQEPEGGGGPSEPPYHPPGGAEGPPGQFQPPTPAGGEPPPQGGHPPSQQPPGYGAPHNQPGHGQPPPFQQPPGYGTPYNQPPYVPGHQAVAAPSSTNASTALALSVSGLVLSLVLGVCCGPFAIAGLALCGVGAYMGHQELTAIDAGLADPANRAQANGARIVGGIGLALCAVVVLGLFFLIVLGSLA